MKVEDGWRKVEAMVEMQSPSKMLDKGIVRLLRTQGRDETRSDIGDCEEENGKEKVPIPSAPAPTSTLLGKYSSGSNGPVNHIILFLEGVEEGAARVRGYKSEGLGVRVT
ncbi:hypothetical protein M0802_003444 [Mischocyttarus mexicanus]|nr:hypothetical protein M0802_003444 [Mischocyttarus mexicanus]